MGLGVAVMRSGKPRSRLRCHGRRGCWSSPSGPSSPLQKGYTPSKAWVADLEAGRSRSHRRVNSHHPLRVPQGRRANERLPKAKAAASRGDPPGARHNSARPGLRGRVHVAKYWAPNGTSGGRVRSSAYRVLVGKTGW